MELLTHVEIAAGRLSAVATDTEGNTVSLSGSELLTRGLPTIKSRRVQVTTDLTTWQPVALDEYAFAVRHPYVGDGAGHACWSFVAAGRRYVVPALALLRALVKGNRQLLEKLMQPQSLDDLCRAAPDGETIHVLQSRWHKHLSLQTQASTAMLLRWLFSFPSARRFWASAYQSALAGKLDFSLPKARFSFSASVKTKGANQYVHVLNLHSIESLEDTFPFMHSQPEAADVHSARSRTENFSSSSNYKSADISPFRVTDELWELLKPLLVPAKAIKKSAHRIHLDCILTSVYCCTTVKHAADVCGVAYTNVSTALCFWRRDGRWKRVLEVVRQHIPPTELSHEETDSKFLRGNTGLASDRRFLMDVAE